MTKEQGDAAINRIDDMANSGDAFGFFGGRGMHKGDFNGKGPWGGAKDNQSTTSAE
jgi:hypothetical protein